MEAYDPNNIEHVLGDDGVSCDYSTPDIVFATWPDGSSATLKRDVDSGRWSFLGHSEYKGFSHACGYVD